MAKSRKYITRKVIENFTDPGDKIPAEIEDEILEAYSTYSLEEDMTTKDIKSYFRDLRIPNLFINGNKRIRKEELIIEGTDVVDFDKLLLKSYQLIKLRNNKDYIVQTWQIIQSGLREREVKDLDLKGLKGLDEKVKTNISDDLLLDMIAVGTDGEDVKLTVVDLGYILGKLGELE